jgi:nucleoside-diphosphate-sugar epimerase
MKKLLVTGGSGFIGSRFIELCQKTYKIYPISLQQFKVDVIDFSEIDAIVHFAGIAHRMQKEHKNLYFEINTDLTLKLAQKAKASGVNHFIYLSSIKVYGKDSSENEIYPKAHCSPSEPYGQSKLASEKGLLKIEDNDFSISIIRPPLVYGEGAKGNLERIMRLITGNYPVPLGNITNLRSMIYRDNLVRYIQLIIDKRSSGVFLPSDNPAISTSELVGHLQKTLNPKKRIIKFPNTLTKIIKYIFPDLYGRLWGTLIINSTETNIRLGYKQESTLNDGLKAMALAYLNKE